MLGREPVARGLDGGVYDRFERPEFGRILENHLRQAIPVKQTILDTAGKPSSNEVDQRSAFPLQSPHLRVRVKDRHPCPFEHSRDRRFSHAYRSCEGNPDHDAINSRSRSAPNKAIRGITRMVKWSPSIHWNSCTPRPSSRNTPTQ